MLKILSLLLLSLLLLSACASQSDPSDTVTRYLEAKVNGDRETISTLICSQRETEIDREALSFAGVEASIEGMTCTANEGNTSVTCSGEIVAVYDGQNRPIPLGTYSVVQEDGEWKWCGEAGE